MLVFTLSAAILALATVAALLAVRPRAEEAVPARGEGALAIYKDQLGELEKEVVRGALTAEEAEAQRVEISRRLLAAAKDQTDAVVAPKNLPRALVLAVPLVAGVLYWNLGSLGQPDLPRAERLAAAAQSNDLEALIAQVEAQLEKNPDDVKGWQLLVPNYLSLGRYTDAAEAMAQIARLKGSSPELFADMAEALVFANKGLPTARSVAINNEALKLDPKLPKALYYRAIELTDEGKPDEAKSIYQDLLATAPKDAPWIGAVQRKLASLAPQGSAPQIGSDQVQAAEAMTGDEQIKMIRGMVDGLDEKLKANPQDIEGWLRVIRARSVLGDADKAKAALATARTTFAAKEAELKQIDELAKELKLN